jgi:putative transcriptional regulator
MKRTGADLAEAENGDASWAEADLNRTKRASLARTVRRALGLTQEQFADRFNLAIGTLRDWEQGRKEPDQAAQNYLRVIATDPDAVAFAMGALPRHLRGEAQKDPSYYGIERVWFVYRETDDTAMTGEVLIPRLPSKDDAVAMAKQFALDHPGVRYGYGYFSPITPNTAEVEFLAFPDGHIEERRVA